MVTLGTLKERFPSLRLEGAAETVVRRVVVDSRGCDAEALFVAVKGHAIDGHRYVADVVAKGCAAVLVSDTNAGAIAAAAGVPVFTVADTQPWPARLARDLNDRPDMSLKVIGVTGTNGKTTTAFLTRDMLAGFGCGLLGTIRYETGAHSGAAPLTTPDGPTLYGLLAEMRDHGFGAVAMEISSHALDQSRVADLALDVAVLTNLSRDHLDYHASLDSYLAAKVRILDLLDGARRGKDPGVAVINADEPLFDDVVADGGPRCVRYSVGRRVKPPSGVDLCLVHSDLSADGTALRYDYRGHALSLNSRLVGRFNVENLTAALAVGLAMSLDPDVCTAALSGADQVPGRIEVFALPQGASAVVDYAHTPEALAAVLDSCRDFTSGRLIVVFGCGGDRDRGKRTEMGAVAARLADDTWITSDNPRSEDPASICDMIYFGFRAETDVRSGACRVEVDRTCAIHGALAAAVDGDTVVIAGKGHETYQIIGDQRLDLDDREIVRDWIGEVAHG